MTTKYKVGRKSSLYSGSTFMHIIRDKGAVKRHRGGRGYFWYGDAVDKLAKYESSRLTPEEVCLLSDAILSGGNISKAVQEIKDRKAFERKVILERIKNYIGDVNGENKLVRKV